MNTWVNGWMEKLLCKALWAVIKKSAIEIQSIYLYCSPAIWRTLSPIKIESDTLYCQHFIFMIVGQSWVNTDSFRSFWCVSLLARVRNCLLASLGAAQVSREKWKVPRSDRTVLSKPVFMDYWLDHDALSDFGSYYNQGWGDIVMPGSIKPQSLEFPTPEWEVATGKSPQVGIRTWRNLITPDFEIQEIPSVYQQ